MADVYRCTLELYDPLFSSDIAVCNRLVPLETDLTIPLAYFLDNPAFKEKDLATTRPVEPDNAQGIKGLYMVEPYDPEPHSGGDGARPVVEPDDVDGDVQRSAGVPRDSQSLSSSGSSCIPPGSRSGSAPRSCAIRWPKCAATLDPQLPIPISISSCSSATAWAGWFRCCRRWKAAMTSGGCCRDRPLEDLRATPDEKARAWPSRSISIRIRRSSAS